MYKNFEMAKKGCNFALKMSLTPDLRLKIIYFFIKIGLSLGNSQASIREDPVPKE